jgi:hypothetical protein
VTAKKPVTIQDMRDLRQKLAEAKERREQADADYRLFQSKMWQAETRRNEEGETMATIHNKLEELGKRFALEGDGEDNFTPKISGTAV